MGSVLAGNALQDIRCQVERSTGSDSRGMLRSTLQAPRTWPKDVKRSKYPDHNGALSATRLYPMRRWLLSVTEEERFSHAFLLAALCITLGDGSLRLGSRRSNRKALRLLCSWICPRVTRQSHVNLLVCFFHGLQTATRAMGTIVEGLAARGRGRNQRPGAGKNFVWKPPSQTQITIRQFSL